MYGKISLTYIKTHVSIPIMQMYRKEKNRGMVPPNLAVPPLPARGNEEGTYTTYSAYSSVD